jgi:phage FluMu protein Com
MNQQIEISNSPPRERDTITASQRLASFAPTRGISQDKCGRCNGLGAQLDGPMAVDCPHCVNGRVHSSQFRATRHPATIAASHRARAAKQKGLSIQ